MEKAKHESFLSMLRTLREFCPPLVPVRVRRVPLVAVLGDCAPVWDSEDRLVRFDIRIAKGLSWDATWQVLIHEWAHALAWQEGHETVDDHDPLWAIALSRIYEDVV